MTDSVMNIGKFEELLHVYGSNLSTWPKENIQAAKNFLQDNQPASDLYKEFSAIDNMFAKGKNTKAPEGLLGNIMKKIDSSED